MLKDSSKEINDILERNVEEAIDRGSLERKLRSGKKLRIKLGIDPTSPNIHIGRAVVLRKLASFQRLGHRVVFIVGDFTGIIGDTSDKDSERPMLSEAEVKKNMKTYFEQAFKILDKNKTETEYNSKWLKKLGFAEIGRLADLFGLHEFSSREVISRRLSSGKRVSLRELLYPLMQGYDSVAVRADVELGGTDQRFNLLAGRTIQAHYNQEPQDILMTELLGGTDGRKMSSSAGNVINITDEPRDMFGKVMSIKDDLVPKYFSLATDIGREEASEIMKLGAMDSKTRLALEITRLYHGDKIAGEAKDFFTKTFREKRTPEDIPSVRFNDAKLSDILQKAEFVASGTEYRRLIRAGAIEADGEVISDPHFRPKKGAIIKIGKKKFLKITPA